MKYLRHFSIPLIILIFVKLIFISGFFAKLERGSQDGLFNIRGKQPLSDDIVIISVDDETFNALDITWPFPREYHAKLIENLNRAGARLIVFDIEFTETTQLEQDGLLAQVAAEHQNVVFAGKIAEGRGGASHQQLYTPIAPIINHNLSWGLVNLGADIDGVMRKYALFHKFDKEPHYTIGITALANSRNYDQQWSKQIKIDGGKLIVRDKQIPLHNQNEALINYFGPAHYFPTHSYSSILDDGTIALPGQQGVETNDFEDILAAGVLKDKIVLVGAYANDLHDYFPTPFSGKAQMPGVEIHANFLEMVLQNKYLSHLNSWLVLLLELILVFALWFIFKKLKPLWGVILLVILGVAHFIIAYQLFVRAGIIAPIIQFLVLFILIYLAGLIRHYLESQKEKRFIRNAFQQYMAPELVSKLLNDPKSLKYGGSLQEVTVLFSDIRGFTTYSEKYKPEETVQILKEYLTAMVNTITANEGIVDKFMGDAIMALFGTPVKLDNSALNACKTALMMRERLSELQTKWRKEGREGLEIGIGINTGSAVVGNLGSEQIFDYTAIGDNINLGARLETINTQYDTQNHIIISEFTLEKVKDQVETRYLDEVKVKGKDKPVKIYELISLK
ncbi:MAG: adenylate/guanylate cyclase domain-containing protein [Candidatus Cloacimonetes bacterium]|nr:adenylate/guanylate cyclase domain-containing protein [Candidatus Cloacimonadota bacterium]